MGNERNESNSLGMFFAFLAGGLIGAAVGLLLAPALGEETRKKVMDSTEDIKGKLRGMTETAKTKIGKVKELGKERLQEQKSIWAEAIEAGKEAIKKEKEFFTKKGEKEEAV
ncbi:MAG: hypothetical protein A2043_11645 [Candidatus Schekmanbacteria bacterium GWA2_38_9]|uniref:Gas vesicle protein n=1 Tax=Candidatus Schekmanbacteria bacterium RIFCSPLOWO2_12_FULL_38_15 TaxID=1817883 RepID=A0A1F7SH86_9BACT|nr:MAG: hypothetical protein A2043_11645 [Candidatus Schekmanbacteria bacterium GWA2_38_9]OGL48614.1 MAG: hypothetical protein A3H37_05990 [Candidatus Schekmanbacteria bacterium RIFCSPLOWO2_02_FULL_38_14]OGL52594.1 MAG: hypothetical protein A3G31_11550 [Candidatus Schekmanbacteria bacterium RIFCSPLOWO2_12_FULL_38_15]